MEKLKDEIEVFDIGVFHELQRKMIRPGKKKMIICSSSPVRTQWYYEYFKKHFNKEKSHD